MVSLEKIANSLKSVRPIIIGGSMFLGSLMMSNHAHASDVQAAKKPATINHVNYNSPSKTEKQIGTLSYDKESGILSHKVTQPLPEFLGASPEYLIKNKQGRIDGAYNPQTGIVQYNVGQNFDRTDGYLGGSIVKGDTRIYGASVRIKDAYFSDSQPKSYSGHHTKPGKKEEPKKDKTETPKDETKTDNGSAKPGDDGSKATNDIKRDDGSKTPGDNIKPAAEEVKSAYDPCKNLKAEKSDGWIWQTNKSNDYTSKAIYNIGDSKVMSHIKASGYIKFTNVDEKGAKSPVYLRPLLEVGQKIENVPHIIFGKYEFRDSNTDSIDNRVTYGDYTPMSATDAKNVKYKTTDISGIEINTSRIDGAKAYDLFNWGKVSQSHTIEVPNGKGGYQVCAIFEAEKATSQKVVGTGVGTTIIGAAANAIGNAISGSSSAPATYSSGGTTVNPVVMPK